MKTNLKKGITLAELLVAVSIFVVLAILVGLFGRDIFSFNSFIQSDLNAQIEGRRAIVVMTSEMREMSPSSLGAYPLAQAATSSVTFFSDIDSDSQKEQVRYYIQGNKLMKSVINPSGSPLVYNSGSAVISTVVNSLSATTTPIFEYYDTNYTGTSSPLSVPVDISQVRLIKISIPLERKRSGLDTPLVLTSNATIRNLRDNI